MSNTGKRRIALAITGASGVQYGWRVLEVLLTSGHAVQLMVSKPAQVVFGTETDIRLPARTADMRTFVADTFDVDAALLQVHGPEEWTASCASGSNPPDAMAICPCSMATLSAVAVGASRSLIERAADVILKERRRLVLVPREAPFSSIHLENMLRLSQAGAIILPPSPGFYGHPQSVGDIIDFVAARVLDQLEIDHALGPRWGADEH
ncbi:MAG: flavin prenyltransferase UbiX [Gammaproteobacteria bacterium]|nr:flavin prenyltransferase UbiX [Gammaproteobacteria bacterium]